MRTAVEQGDVGLYDPDAKLLMEVLNSGEELSDAGFVVGPEDNGRKSISKDGKVLFVGKIESNQLKEGQLNVKFTKDKKTNKYVPSEYYVGKFKNNLFEDENGKHTFAERYNTGIQERYDGGFSEGTQDGKGTFYNAHGISSNYEYDHGNIVSREGFMDMNDTDVIVFGAAVSFQFENIFDDNGILSKQNLINFFENAKNHLIEEIEAEKTGFPENCLKKLIKAIR